MALDSEIGALLMLRHLAVSMSSVKPSFAFSDHPNQPSSREQTVISVADVSELDCAFPPSLEQR